MRAQRRLPKQGNQKSNVISIGERRPGLIGRYRSADERRAEGRALRDAVPRELHGGWKAPSDRRDPVELLTESNKGRMPQLIPIRHGRMVESPFAFYRGSAAARFLDREQSAEVDAGAPLQPICRYVVTNGRQGLHADFRSQSLFACREIPVRHGYHVPS